MCCKLMFFFWFGCGNAKIVPVAPRRNRNRSTSVAVFSCVRPAWAIWNTMAQRKIRLNVKFRLFYILSTRTHDFMDSS